MPQSGSNPPVTGYMAGASPFFPNPPTAQQTAPRMRLERAQTAPLPQNLMGYQHVQFTATNCRSPSSPVAFTPSPIQVGHWQVVGKNLAGIFQQMLDFWRFLLVHVFVFLPCWNLEVESQSGESFVFFLDLRIQISSLEVLVVWPSTAYSGVKSTSTWKQTDSRVRHWYGHIYLLKCWKRP